MTPIVNLHILAEKFTQLSKSVFFDPAFTKFAERTVEAIHHVIEHSSSYPEPIVRRFVSHVWAVLQFVRGSRSNDAPYETQFVLRKALREWIDDDVLISSSALDSFDFFLSSADLWEYIEQTIGQFDTGGYKPLVVRIGSPEAFKHRPIFCIPLFHELGHFVDFHFKISDMSILVSPPNQPPTGLDPQTWQRLNLNHRREYFADLFAACYCGHASIKTLLAVAPNNGSSFTHPSTAERVKVVADFLAGVQNEKVDLFQATLTAQQLPNLKQRFVCPEVRHHFDDALTHQLSCIEELFGIFSSGWDYLHEELEKRTAPWIDDTVDASIIEKTVNDLVEKSIRNFEIVERWQDVTSDKK